MNRYQVTLEVFDSAELQIIEVDAYDVRQAQSIASMQLSESLGAGIVVSVVQL
jgi:hypothetical protein